MGVHRVLVVSNWEVAKECLKTNDRVFVDRPKSIGLEIMGYNNTMYSFGPYGPYWRELRKISTIELLSIHRVERMKPVRDSVTRFAIEQIYRKYLGMEQYSRKSSGKLVVEMKEWFSNINLDHILRVIVGKSLFLEEVPNTNQQMGATTTSGFEAFREFFELMQVSLISDDIPFLRWFDIGGVEKAMRNTAKKIDTKLQQWLEEHKTKKQGMVLKDDQQQDFMGVLLNILDQSTSEPLVQEDADKIIKSTCLAMLIAGADTSTITLTWALSLLLNNPHTLKKAQNELDTHVGRHRQVDESDIKNLVYLQAIIKETLRLYPNSNFIPS